MPELEKARLESDLREALPVHLRDQAGVLAQFLTELARGPDGGGDSRERSANERGVAAAVEALAGQRVGPLLTFGEGNHMGQVTVGNVAGGHIVKINIAPVGGDVMRRVVVQGDGNRVFTGDFESLRDAYISPEAVFQRVALDRFAGRGWLADEVDAFLRGCDHGYFILEADAGVGKTTFLAWLVKQRGYIHFFAEQAPGQDGIDVGLRSLAAQVIRAWDLRPYADDGVIPGSAVRPDFLDRLLREAADVRDLRRPGEPIVLAVDGLDEAGTPPGLNVLGLPRTLPKGVYLIVAYRVGAVALRVESPKHVFRLEANADANLGDMRTYLEQAARRSPIAGALSGADGPEAFTRALMSKCQGVWIYLHYVIDEVERGHRHPHDLDTLPDNHWEYYADFWRRQRDADPGAWEEVLVPLLCTLAAYQEGLTAETLFRLAGVPQALAVYRRILDERWRAFLKVDDSGERRLYRPYHASMRDFLEGRVDLTEFQGANRSFSLGLTATTVRSHGRIADFYLSSWGGMAEALPRLGSAVGPGMDEGYGLRHLPAHLTTAGRVPELHRLLRLERWEVVARPGPFGRLFRRSRRGVPAQSEPVWFAAHERAGQVTSFLNALAHAWRLADDAAAAETSAAACGHAVGLQCRYALITASINSRAHNIPPELLAMLVRSGIWSPDQGIAYALQMPGDGSRFHSLEMLSCHLAKAGRIPEAMTVARSLPPSSLFYGGRLGALAQIATIAPQHARSAIIREALAISKASTFGGLHGFPYESLFAAMPEPLLPEGLDLARSSGGVLRVAMLAAIAKRLHGQEQLSMLTEALRYLENIVERETRAKALSALASLLPVSLLPAAVAVARGLGVEHEFRGGRGMGKPLADLEPGWALAAEQDFVTGIEKLAPRLAQLGASREAMDLTQAVKDRVARAKVLALMLPHLPPAEREVALAEARETVRAIENIEGRAADKDKRAKDAEDVVCLRARIAPQLPAVEATEELRSALRIALLLLRLGRAWPLDALIDLLPVPLFREAMDQLQKTFGAAMFPFRKMLIKVAERGDVEAALERARTINMKYQRVGALASLSEFLPTAEQLRLLHQLHDEVRLIGDEPKRAFARSIFFVVAGDADRASAEARSGANTASTRDPLVWAVAGLAPTLEPASVGSAFAVAQAVEASAEMVTVMAALAPRLPPPLLRAAVSVARSVPDPATRAGALTALLPAVPELERPAPVRRAVQAVKAIKDISVKIAALEKLRPYLTEAEWSDALRAPEAVAKARSLTPASSRAAALVSLVPWLADLDRVPVAGEALEAACAVEDVRLRLKILGSLVRHLAPARRRQVIDEVGSLALSLDTFDRARVVRELASQLAEAGLEDEALEVAGLNEPGRERGQTLAATAPYLAEPALRRALAAARQSDGHDMLATAIRGLAPRLAALGFPGEALAEVRSLSPTEESGLALGALCQFLSAPERADVLPDALRVAREVDRWVSLFKAENERAGALGQLVPFLKELPHQTLMPLWSETLHVLARRNRADILADLKVLSPLILALGGHSALFEAAQSVEDVGRWFP